MLQQSKLIRSRNEWKDKAVSRSIEIRRHRKTNRRHQKKIIELQEKIKQLEAVVEDNKKNQPTLQQK